jgi:type I restriction enzyme S subunit
MNKQQKKALVPELRFPEFRDAGEWVKKEVGDVFEITRGYVLSMSLVKDEPSHCTPYPVYSSQTKNNGLAGYYSEFLYENAITWTTDGANAGDVNYRQGKFYCTNVCGVLLNKDGFANPCIAALINSVSKNYVSYVGNPKLMNGVMSKIVIPFPEIKEQQKIADCLSSIDELITSQTQKVEALKAHKKGLMQQLFPAEGETVPKLRFPEFRDAGEWKYELLGNENISIFVKERTPLEGLILETYISTENLLPDYEGVTIASKLPPSGSFTCFRKGDILISNIRPYLRKIWVADKDGASSNDVIIIRASTKIINLFLGFILKNDEFINYMMRGAKGVKMPRGDIQSIKEYPILLPSPEEQKKIAACLSSTDELITAQIQKINTLKAHKKGLMQQLFPAIDEVTG